jgi:hypothetical protein
MKRCVFQWSVIDVSRGVKQMLDTAKRSPWFANYTRLRDRDREKAERLLSRSRMVSSLQRHLNNTVNFRKEDGFDRIEKCRMALRVLDENGWRRSHHQRIFHENYIRATSRVFFKADGEGAFMRAHQKLLQVNNWENIQSEVLISTPRRFGKTISVSLFAACMIFSCAKVEISIYSTCKRISQKLLRNVLRYLAIIHDALKIPKYKTIRENAEELICQGPDGIQDIRVVNSYPSRVRLNPSHPPHSATSASMQCCECVWV